MLWDVSHLFGDTCQKLYHFQIYYRSWHAYKLSWPSPNICWVNERSCCGVFLMSSHTETTWCSTRLKVTVSYCVVIIITRDQKLDSCRKRFGFWKLLVIMPMCVCIYIYWNKKPVWKYGHEICCLRDDLPTKTKKEKFYVHTINIAVYNHENFWLLVNANYREE